MDFRVRSIGEICTRICSGGTPKSNISEYYNNGSIPWLNTKEVSFNRIRNTEKYITEEGLNNSSAKWISKNSVIVAMYGATAGKSAIAKIPLTTNQACCNLEVNPKMSDYRYVYYWLKNHYEEISSLANGGAQQNLNAGQIRSFPISLPSLENQKKIALILDSIDIKIDLDNRINDYLAELASLEFSRHFGPDTPTTELGKVLSISTKSLKPQDCIGDIWEHYSIPAYDENRRPIFEPAECIKSNKYIVDTNCILISKLNPTIKRIWMPACTSDHPVCSTEFIVYKPNNLKHKSFYYAAINAPEFTDYLLAHVTGSTGSRQRTQPKATLKYPMQAPSVEAIDEFCAFADPIYEQIKLNELESGELEVLRDTLLPKLISGEIDVSKVKLPKQLNNHFACNLIN